ncbi:hypothetical protein AB0J72_26170 [Dactylosporangium sp. NPDC049742]|uniref:hypothetical protein n=1 Tax=Dactylosporangium sp. NPDC049742 TaxID=3154737 RepID=UPI0034179429
MDTDTVSASDVEPGEPSPPDARRPRATIVFIVAMLVPSVALLVAFVVRPGPFDFRFHAMVLLFAVALAALLMLLRLRQRRIPRAVNRTWVVVAALWSVIVGVAVVGSRGVVWPWTPTATRTDSACSALDAAGLDPYWPANSRRLLHQESDPMSHGVRTRCDWFRRDDEPGGPVAPFLGLTGSVTRYDGEATRSSIAVAVDRFASDRIGLPEPRTLRGIGDEAFVSAFGTGVRIFARRANVVVTVDILRYDGGVGAGQAEEAARALAAAMLGGVSLH